MTNVRRKDRQITDEMWIKQFLSEQPVGVIAAVEDGQPMLNSNLFAYDEDAHAIIFHTARVGHTRRSIGAESRVCFTVFEMGRLLPAAEALEFSVEYASVVVFGVARLVTDPAQAERGLQLLLDKYAPHLRPGEHYRPITPEEIKRTSVFEITIERWTAKRKQVAEDFPGAFIYGDPNPPTFEPGKDNQS